nr:hypothetical protein [Tanacetum cinerariifolium]
NQVGHGVGRGRGNFREQTQTGYPLLRNGDMKASDEIEILHTDTLIKEEHERALIDVIAKLAEASDAPDSDG